jgi:two-component system phosphate regulon response regulator PhoB
MAGEKILVVEDEPDIQELHRYNLSKEGYQVLLCSNGNDALVQIRRHKPDLILLDLLLPGRDGLDVCRTIRQDSQLNATGIIMVTAKGEESDIISGLELGADDYVTKPFSTRVLLARIHTVLRKRSHVPETGNSTEISIFGIKIDTERFTVHVDGKPVELTAGEFALLTLLTRNPGIVLSRNRIINMVKGENYAVTERSVDVQILGLRKKLGSRGQSIKTVRGIGYRLEDTGEA